MPLLYMETQKALNFCNFGPESLTMDPAEQDSQHMTNVRYFFPNTRHHRYLERNTWHWSYAGSLAQRGPWSWIPGQSSRSLKLFANRPWGSVCVCRSLIRNILVILPVLGITWVFGVIAVNSDLVAFQFIFAVANSLQVTLTRSKTVHANLSHLRLVSPYRGWSRSNFAVIFGNKKQSPWAIVWFCLYMIQIILLTIHLSTSSSCKKNFDECCQEVSWILFLYINSTKRC